MTSAFQEGGQHTLIRPSPINGAMAPNVFKAPKGIVSGDFIITDYDALAKATQSDRLHKFINIGKMPAEMNINRGRLAQTTTSVTPFLITPVATIPQYVARKSQNELKALAAKDPTLRGMYSLFHHPFGLLTPVQPR